MNPYDDEDCDNSGSDDDDFEALRRAFDLTGTNPNDLNENDNSLIPPSDSDSDSVDDIQLVNNIKNRLTSDLALPFSLQPLVSLPPSTSSDDDEDDFATLRAIQKRFSSYSIHNDDVAKSGDEHCSRNQVRASRTPLEKESSNNLFVNRPNACERFPDTEDTCTTSQNLESLSNSVPEFQNSACIEWHESIAPKQQSVPLNYSSFPRSAQLLFDAIKKNRSCQKYLQSKLIHLEARIEENIKLKDRVKLLKQFQISCKKRTGRALSQKKDPRVLLISTAEADDKRSSKKFSAPEDNDHVAKYKMALEKFPFILRRERWSKEERENLGKGIIQDIQKTILDKALSCSGGSSGISNDIDDVITSIKDLEITPDKIRSYIPNIDWEKFAFTYLKSRSGAECEARWLNWEDPLINRDKWTRAEDKSLMLIAEQKQMDNWIDIAVSLGTGRTPFQCLARYQRSLNSKMLNRGWTKEEDAQLCYLVKIYGAGDWQLIASKLGRRAGTQCSNRWKKSLNPARLRVGRWTVEEDTRLRIAVMLFGPKTWKKIEEFVPGRTQVQCRERWVNCLDPSLNWGDWTEDEDEKLMQAIKEHGYRWSKVAACVPPRTDSQCRRRWKLLCPEEVPKLQAAKKIQQVALISNFVDRESERPCLGPDDFAPLPELCWTPMPEDGFVSSEAQKTAQCANDKDGITCKVPMKLRPIRARKNAQISKDEVSCLASCNGANIVCNREIPQAVIPKIRQEAHIFSGEDGADACSGHEASVKLRPKRQRRHSNEFVLGVASCDGGDASGGLEVPKKVQPKRPRDKAQTRSKEVSGVVNCDGADASGNHETPKEVRPKRPRKKAKMNNGEASSVPSCNGVDASHNHEDPKKVRLRIPVHIAATDNIEALGVADCDVAVASETPKEVRPKRRRMKAKFNSGEALGLARCDRADASGNHDAPKKFRRTRPWKKGENDNGEASDVVDCDGIDAPSNHVARKKVRPKRFAKKAETNTGEASGVAGCDRGDAFGNRDAPKNVRPTTPGRKDETNNGEASGVACWDRADASSNHEGSEKDRARRNHEVNNGEVLGVDGLRREDACNEATKTVSPSTLGKKDEVSNEVADIASPNRADSSGSLDENMPLASLLKNDHARADSLGSFDENMPLASLLKNDHARADSSGSFDENMLLASLIKNDHAGADSSGSFDENMPLASLLKNDYAGADSTSSLDENMPLASLFKKKKRG